MEENGDVASSVREKSDDGVSSLRGESSDCSTA